MDIPAHRVAAEPAREATSVVIGADPAPATTEAEPSAKAKADKPTPSNTKE